LKLGVSIVFLHFLAGTVGALAVFLVSERLSGATSFTAPFGIVFIGLVCAGLAHFLSPWATLAVLLLYALAGINEYVREQASVKAGDE